MQGENFRNRNLVYNPNGGNPFYQQPSTNQQVYRTTPQRSSIINAPIPASRVTTTSGCKSCGK